MAARDRGNEALIFVLLLALLEDEGAYFSERFYQRFRDRLLRSKSWSPRLDKLFRSLDRRDPDTDIILSRELRGLLRSEEIWDPQLDEVLEHVLRRRRGYPREHTIEEITRGAVAGFVRHIERDIERSGREVSERITGIEASSERTETRLSKLENATELMRSELQQHRNLTDSDRSEMHNYAWMLSAGVDLSAAKLLRYVPARVLIGDPVPDRNVLENVAESLKRLASELGFELADDIPEQSGSWWKRFFFRTREFLSQDEVQDRVGAAERALKVKHLDKPQAEANRDQAEAASKLIEALKDTPAACVQVGSLLLVKAPSANGDSAVFARTLTPQELKELEENQAMLGEPARILQWLQGCGSKQLPEYN